MKIQFTPKGSLDVSEAKKEFAHTQDYQDLVLSLKSEIEIRYPDLKTKGVKDFSKSLIHQVHLAGLAITAPDTNNKELRRALREAFPLYGAQYLDEYDRRMRA